jgi:hypothetical protein
VDVHISKFPHFIPVRRISILLIVQIYTLVSKDEIMFMVQDLGTPKKELHE